MLMVKRIQIQGGRVLLCVVVLLVWFHLGDLFPYWLNHSLLTINYLYRSFYWKRKPGSFYFTLYILFLFLAFQKNILLSWRRCFVFRLYKEIYSKNFSLSALCSVKERTMARPTTLNRLTWFCPFYEVKYRVVNERGRVEIHETYVFSVHIIKGMGLWKICMYKM